MKYLIIAAVAAFTMASCASDEPKTYTDEELGDVQPLTPEMVDHPQSPAEEAIQAGIDRVRNISLGWGA